MHYKDEKYNLCKIAFHPETGTYGDHVDTLFNAVAMGKSLTWPRPSYDGKYLLFTLSDYGYFSIWHQESEQWLLDLQTGEARPLDEINSPRADSYHNWNVNSHWIVFTSRRVDGSPLCCLRRIRRSITSAASIPLTPQTSRTAKCRSTPVKPSRK